MKRTAVSVACAVVASGLAGGCGGDDDSGAPKRPATKPREPRMFRLAAPELARRGMRFAAFLDHGVPCVDYRVPGTHGGRCLQGLAEGGNASFDIGMFPVGDVTVLVGAAVPEARTIRIAGDVRPPLRVDAGPVVERIGLRFFVTRVPSAARNARPADLASLDRNGRVLSHYLSYYKRKP